MLCSSEDLGSTGVCSHMAHSEGLGRFVRWILQTQDERSQTADTEEHILFASIYLEYKNR